MGRPNLPESEEITMIPPLDFLRRGKADFVRYAFE